MQPTNVVDTTRVCGHLKALGSEAGIPERITQVFVGRLNSLPPDKYLEYCKDVSTVFTHAIYGDFHVSRSNIPHLGVVGTFIHPALGECNRFKEPFINSMLYEVVPFTETTDNLWAGMTNLKSGLAILHMSRSEKSAAVANITHEATVDNDLLAEWLEFVPRFVQHMSDAHVLEHPREYDPIWSVPRSEVSTSYYDSAGRIRPCKVGSLQATDIITQMRHPMIKRIASQHPSEFASAVLAGGPVTTEQMFVPVDTLPESTPIGRITVAPKVAQKWRIVAVPLSIIDSMSRPLFYQLAHINRSVAISAVYNQDAARMKIYDFLHENHGSKTYSFDQSSYTDNLSYPKLQRPILEELEQIGYVCPFDLQVVDIANYGNYDATNLGHKHPISWGTGTGMGTRPSFPLASLTNVAIAYFCYECVHGTLPSVHSRDPFAYVVGDDFWTKDPDVGEAYINFCERSGLKLNTAKTVIDVRSSEFCGKIITSNGIFDKHKIMPEDSYGSIADTAMYYQKLPRAFEEWKGHHDPDIQHLIDLICRMPQPYGNAAHIKDQPINRFTPENCRLLLAYLSHQSRSIIPDSLKEADYRTMFKRRQLMPKVTWTPISEPDLPTGCNITDYDIQLAYNIQFLYEESKDEHDSDKLYEYASQAFSIYYLLGGEERINDLRPPVEPHVAMNSKRKGLDRFRIAQFEIDENRYSDTEYQFE